MAEPALVGDQELTSSPMSIPLVQERVAFFLDFESIKSFRLACRDFYSNTKSVFREAIPVRLTFEDNNNLAWPGRKCIPKSYELIDWDFCNYRDIRYANFINVCSPHADYLKLTDCRFGEIPESAGFLTLMKKLGPKVTTLEFHNCKIPQKADLSAEKMPYLRKVVMNKCAYILPAMSLIKFPNLKELIIEDSGVWRCVPADYVLDHDYISTLYTLRRVSWRDPILKLTRFDALRVRQKNYSAFTSANLPLEHLQILVTTELETEELLSHYGPKLETLQVHKPITYKNHRQTFDGFPFKIWFGTLTRLELWGNIVSNLDFLLAMPLLQKLRVDVNCLDLQPLVNIRNRLIRIIEIPDLVPMSKKLLGKKIEMPHLREFSFDWEASPESWGQLAEWMPHLVSINAPVNRQILGIIWHKWSLIENLKARYGSYIDDDVLLNTEIPENLNSLEIETGCGMNHITQESISKVFSGREHFLQLRLSASYDQISKESEATLSQEIPRLEIYRSKCLNDHATKMISKDNEEISRACFWTVSAEAKN